MCYYVPFFFAIITLTTSWELSPIKLPRLNSYTAIGYYNDIIYLLGGKQFKKELLQYNIPDNVLIDNGTTALAVNTFGESKYYTQINNYLYIIQEAGNKFSRYDFATNIFEDKWENITIEVDVDKNGCLTSNGDYLFIAGGKNGLNNLQILDITTKTWLVSPPSMNEPRSFLTCVIHSNTNRLYVIGGYNNGAGGQYLDTLEYIYIGNMNNVLNENWIPLTDTLIKKSSESASVEYNEYIYIIGGYNEDNGHTVHNEVQILDTATNDISVESYLNYSTTSAPAILVNRIIYTFGGWGGGNGLDTWQYYKIPTDSPTYSPIPTSPPTTFEPTTIPTTNAPTTRSPTTIIPTTIPTNMPVTALPTTNAPTTMIPTIMPTNMPITALPTTNIPTNNPTTQAPTTKSPTPLITTTLDPTSIPTTSMPTSAVPTGSNTVTPTNNPSIGPVTLMPVTDAPAIYSTHSTSDTLNVLLSTSMHESMDTTENESMESISFTSSDTFLYIIISISIVICFIGIFVIFYMYLRRKKKMLYNIYSTSGTTSKNEIVVSNNGIEITNNDNVNNSPHEGNTLNNTEFVQDSDSKTNDNDVIAYGDTAGQYIDEDDNKTDDDDIINYGTTATAKGESNDEDNKTDDEDIIDYGTTKGQIIDGDDTKDSDDDISGSDIVDDNNYKPTLAGPPLGELDDDDDDNDNDDVIGNNNTTGQYYE